MRKRKSGTLINEKYHPRKLKHKKKSLIQEIREIDLEHGDWLTYNLKGFLSLMFGIMLLVWEESLIFLVIVMGIQAVLKGAIGLIRVIMSARKSKEWGLLLLESVAGLILGVLIISWPEASIYTAAVLIGIWMLTTGVIELGEAVFDNSRTERSLLGAGGFISVIVGLILIAIPAETVHLVHILSGIHSVLLGAIFIGLGVFLMLRPDTG